MARNAGNVTKGGRARPKSILQVRQDKYEPDPKYAGARKMPGSNNKHKCFPH